MNNPYDEKILNENTRVRTFNSNVSEDHLIWHRDRQDRVVEVIHSNGWLFQRDDSVPILMSPGDKIQISTNEWHRIIKGEGDLVLKIIEEKKDQNKDGKNDFDDVRIARMLASDEYDSIEQIKKDHPDLFEKYINEKKKKKQVVHDPNYKAPEGSKRDKQLDRARELYKKGDVKAAARIRQRMEKKARKEPGYKNKPRKDTGRYTESASLLNREILKEMIEDVTEEMKLDELLKELEQRIQEKKGKSPKGLSKAVKKSLDKKADKRCLTRGSVYAEFRKGLAAYLSSGSRKGMTAHQWAHARVNSAQPSKSWATVKKRKKCPKKK
tara:strand:- start:1271 stop:2245 length:975 start_codon:yes stop_codon:yes gene_type:complete